MAFVYSLTTSDGWRTLWRPEEPSVNSKLTPLKGMGMEAIGGCMVCLLRGEGPLLSTGLPHIYLTRLTKLEFDLCSPNSFSM